MPGTLLKSNSFEGVSAGVDIVWGTSGNTGGSSGDVFTGGATGSGSTAQGNSSAPFRGSRSARLAQGSTATSVYGEHSLGSTYSDVHSLMGFRFSTVPAGSSIPIMRFYSGATLVATAAITNTRKIQLIDVQANNVATSTYVLTAGLADANWYVLSVRYTSGGTLTCDVYAKGSSTSLLTLSVTPTAGTISAVRYGMMGSNMNMTLDMDDCRVGQGGLIARSDLAGGGGSTVKPVAIASFPIAFDAGTVNAPLDGTNSGSSVGASIVGYNWVALTPGAPALTNPNTATPTIDTAPSLATTQSYDYSLSVTDSNGNSSDNVCIQTVIILQATTGTGTDPQTGSVPAHAFTHAKGGSDAIAPADIGARSVSTFIDPVASVSGNVVPNQPYLVDISAGGAFACTVLAGQAVDDEAYIKVTGYTDGAVLAVGYDVGVTGPAVTLDGLDQAVTMVWTGNVWIIKSHNWSRALLNDRFSSPFPTRLVTNDYFALNGQGGTSTGTLTQAREIAIPFFIYRDISIARLAAEISTVGTTGSVIRLGIRAFDLITGYPVNGAPLLDAGTIDGTVAAVAEITLGSALAVKRGWYFYTVTQQGAPGTLSTMRLCNNSGIFLPGSIKAASAAAVLGTNTIVGYYQAGVTGALPSSWTNAGATGLAPKVAARVS